MTSRKIIISILLVILVIFSYCIYYFFYSYDTFVVSGSNEISNIKYGTYENNGIADQVVYNSKINRHVIGKTTNGDLICELKDDPSHKQLVLIQNTEMPAWFLYSKKFGGLPLPSSVKKSTDNVVLIPFPYMESKNGEQWIIDRDTSNRFVIRVLNDGKEVASFPVEEAESQRKKETILLGGQKYIVMNITINNDKQSGHLTLEKIQ